jgi:hypothetical protein
VSRTHALIVIAAIAAVACTGTARPASAPAAEPQWPQRVLWHESYTQMYAEQVLDQTADVLYTLAPATDSASQIPNVLGATNLRTGHVRRGGGSYQQDGLALASGYLWVYGGTVLDEVDPRTLGTIRSITLPQAAFAAEPYNQVAGVVAGPPGSVWVGASRALIRLSTRTGAVLGRVAVPAGLNLDDVDDLPGGTYLYAAAQRPQPAFGAVVLEYSAGTGRLLARTSADPLPFSLAGADLTAVPGGVWAWFRTGMDGQSMLLSAPSLRIRSGPPWPSESIYNWGMGSSSIYGGGALWVMTDDGLQACVNPATGRAIAEQRVTSSTAQPAIVLGADQATGQLIALILSDDSAVVVGVSPPRACWKLEYGACLTALTESRSTARTPRGWHEFCLVQYYS